MAYGDLKVRNLIWNTGSGDNTVVLSTLATQSYVTTNFAPKANPAFTGSATGVNLTLSGNLVVNGTTTTINTQTLDVEDKNISLGKVSNPSDTTADGGGITLLGSSNKTFNWVNATDAWTSSEHIYLGDNKKLLLGVGAGGVQDLQIYSNGSEGILGIPDGGTLKIKDGSNTMATFSGASNQLDIHVHTVFIGASSNASWDKANNRFSGTITEINVTANNSTNETCYPLFADGATGSQGAETDTGLSYNPSTGLFTSTAFSGSGANLTTLNASNLSSGTVATGRLGSGTANSGTFLAGDNTWQAISAAPEITATASGAIAAGKGVIVNSNGSVSQATVTAAAFGSRTSMSIPDNMEGGTIPDHDIIWCEAHNCFVQVYKATSSNDYGRIRCGTLSGTTITWGSYSTYASDQCYENRCVYDSVNDLIIVAYRNMDSSARVQVQQVKISGTTIVSVSATATPNGSLGMSELGLATDGKGSCVITYRYSSNGKAQRVYANAATTGAPSFDSVQDIQGYSNNNFRFNSIAYSPDDDKFLCCWTDAANGRGVGRLITITGTSGNSLTFSSTPGTGNYFHTGGYPRDIKLTYNTNINKFVCVYNNSVRDMYARVGIISSGEIGWGTEVQITAANMSSNYDPSHIFNPQSFKHSVYWKDGDDSNKLKHADITISGTTPSMGSITTLESTYTNNEYSMAGVSNAGDEINVWQAAGNGLQYIVRSGETTTLTSTNFIGFASAGYSNGNTATVKVTGNTLTGQSGLTGGTKVYVQRNGDISHTPAIPSVEAGIALSSTKLLIKG